MYQVKLMLKRKEFQITFFIMTAVCIAAFLVSCFQNFSDELFKVVSADRAFILRDRSSDFVFLLVYALPVFVVLPFADSYYTDNTENTIPLVLARVGAKRYFFSKLKAVALSSVLVTFIPLSINYLLCLIAFPPTSTLFEKHGPSAEQTSYYSDRALQQILFPETFIYHPYLYNFIFLVMLTLFLMICAVLVYEMSYYIKKSRFLVLSILFVANDVLILLSNLLVLGDSLAYAPHVYFIAYDVTPGKSIGYLIFMYAFVIFAILCLMPGCISRLNGKKLK